MDIIAGILKILGDMHSDLGWDTVVGEIFQKIVEELTK